MTFESVEQFFKQRIDTAAATTPEAPVWPLRALPLAKAYHLNIRPLRLMRELLGLSPAEAAEVCQIDVQDLKQQEALTLNDEQSQAQLETLLGRLAMVLVGFTAEGALQAAALSPWKHPLRALALDYRRGVGMDIRNSNRIGRAYRRALGDPA